MISEVLLQRMPFWAYETVAPTSASSGSRSQGNSSSPGSSASSTTAGPAYALELSKQGLDQSRQTFSSQKSSESETFQEQNSLKQQKTDQVSSENQELSEEEAKLLQEMKKTDQKVRTHEQAHLSSAGGYAQGGIHLETDQGPDGKQYAVAGHVDLDTSPEDTPEGTLRKANIIRKAALAPADPSGEDRAVAAKANQMAAEARQQIAEKQNQKQQGKPVENNSDMAAKEAPILKIPVAYQQRQSALSSSMQWIA